ncbi:MAG: homocysteine S-methyltransferase family protein [Anaerolineales bacterium]|nr:homocysteine S-methyltransferase family protein [Anaerolineales bacterium]
MSEKTGLLERLSKGVVLGAEGYVFELERRGYIKAGPFVPEVVLDYPEAVKQLHREFLLAGSEVMVALTYYGDREKLKVVGREGELESLNRQAVRLAREVAAEGNALVAGNIANTWVYDHHDKEATSKKVRQIYTEQVQWAVDEGADFIIAETLEYLGEGLLALEVIKKFGLPAMITFGSILDFVREGVNYVEACKTLASEGADIVGLNCSRGPETMLPLLRDIRQAVSCYVAAQPVPYHTTPEQAAFQHLRLPGRERAFPIALEPFLCDRFEMADFARQAQEIGVNYIGICCGAGPHHVRAMAEALGRTTPASRYSPDLALHPMIGSDVKDKDREFLKHWKD